MPRRHAIIDGYTFRAFPEYGAYYAVDGRSLLYAAMLVNGEPDTEIGACVVASDAGNDVEAQQFCDVINGEFGSLFIPSNFPGR